MNTDENPQQSDSEHPGPGQPGEQTRFTISNTNATGSSFPVRGCAIGHNRARGLMLKASDGLIKNCTLERITISGILVCREQTGRFLRTNLETSTKCMQVGYETGSNFGPWWIIAIALMPATISALIGVITY